MTKSRIVLVHGWGGSPSGDWFPWAKQELENLGHEVVVPIMPETDKPIISSWVDHLSKVVEEPRPDDIYIGHSIGCQTILRYLEEVETKVNKVILVAPWFTLTNLENEDAWRIADPWFKTPMDFARIKNKAKTFITIFSDNDSWVPYQENMQLFKERLNPQIVTLHGKGHMTAEEGSTELPELLDCI